LRPTHQIRRTGNSSLESAIAIAGCAGAEMT
jgi:hypothetical protein